MDARLIQQKRRPGARDFIRAGAVEHNVAIARNLLMAIFTCSIVKSIEPKWSQKRVPQQVATR